MFNCYGVRFSERTETDGSTTYIMTLCRKEGQKLIETDYVSKSPITLEGSFLMQAANTITYERVEVPEPTEEELAGSGANDGTTTEESS